MWWHETEASRRFADVAQEARAMGAQFISGAVEADLIVTTAEEYRKLKDGISDSDPLCEAGPPYFDDLELPDRHVWPTRHIDLGLMSEFPNRYQCH